MGRGRVSGTGLLPRILCARCACGKAGQRRRNMCIISSRFPMAEQMMTRTCRVFVRAIIPPFTCKKGFKRNMAVHPNDKYGRLIVLRRGEDYLYRGQKQPRWVCKCACGNEILVRACHLLSGNTQSCGCLRRTRNQSRPHKVQYVFHNDYVECRLTNGIVSAHGTKSSGH